MKCFKINGCGIYNPAPFFIALSVILFIYCQSIAFADMHVKALWIVRDSISNSEKTEEAVNYAAAHGYTDIFVQLRGRGDAYYKSSFVPGPVEYPTIPEYYDPLDNVIKLAHKRGLKVHAWFNMLLTWSSVKNPKSVEHPVNAHKDWFMVSSDGLKMINVPLDTLKNHNIEGRFISPVYPDVRDYFVKVITEVILKYDVDGVHLDYIRYPNQDYDFNDLIRDDFIKKENSDPVDIVKSNSVDDNSIKQFENFQNYRASLVTGLVRQISERVKNSGKKITLSAAVKPDIDEAFTVYGQDWGKWLDEGLIDFAALMNYYQNCDKVQDILEKALKTVTSDKLVMGVGLYKLTKEETLKQLEITDELKIKGFSIFSYKVLKENRELSDTVDSFKDNKK
jgi:uncharacterized lipoprotein YddW (UPF0748 family)